MTVSFKIYFNIKSHITSEFRSKNDISSGHDDQRSLLTGCEHESLVRTKACNESYEEQLPDFDSWALTAGILLNKVLFFSNKRTRL